MWLQNVESCSHKIEMWLQNVESCSHVTATFEMWLQYFKICNYVTATFEIWLQNSKSDRKIHKYDGKFLKMTATFFNDCNLKKMLSPNWDS